MSRDPANQSPAWEKRDVPSNIYQSAFQLFKAKRPIYKFPEGPFHIIASSTNLNTTPEELRSTLDGLIAGTSFITWEEFKLERSKIHVVADLTGTGFYTCTCYQGAKKLPCKHVTMIQCHPSVGTDEYPAHIDSPVLEAKKRRGRPKKALSRALIID